MIWSATGVPWSREHSGAPLSWTLVPQSHCPEAGLRLCWREIVPGRGERFDGGGLLFACDFPGSLMASSKQRSFVESLTLHPLPPRPGCGPCRGPWDKVGELCGPAFPDRGDQLHAEPSSFFPESLLMSEPPADPKLPI